MVVRRYGEILIRGSSSIRKLYERAEKCRRSISQSFFSIRISKVMKQLTRVASTFTLGFPADGYERTGMRRICPTSIRSPVSPFSCLIASTVVPYLLERSQRVSPGRTVYSNQEGEPAAGILRTCPMSSMSLVSPFNCLIASTVVSYLRERSQRVSPACTV